MDAYIDTYELIYGPIYENTYEILYGLIYGHTRIVFMMQVHLVGSCQQDPCTRPLCTASTVIRRRRV